MAATDVYAKYSSIPAGTADLVLSNSDATSDPFTLKGGWYAIDVILATPGTVTLQKLGPDGTTYITAATAIAANGSVVLQLGAGTYKFALA